MVPFDVIEPALFSLKLVEIQALATSVTNFQIVVRLSNELRRKPDHRW